MTAGPQNKDWGQSRSKHQNNEKTTPRTHANTWMHKSSDLTTPPHASHIFCPALAFTNQRWTHIMLQKVHAVINAWTFFLHNVAAGLKGRQQHILPYCQV